VFDNNQRIQIEEKERNYTERRTINDWHDAPERTGIVHRVGAIACASGRDSRQKRVAIIYFTVALTMNVRQKGKSAGRCRLASRGHGRKDMLASRASIADCASNQSSSSCRGSKPRASDR
jgi:hypothetical protein